MDDVDGMTILQAACFRLGMAGSQITQVFSQRVERLGLTHKQVGLLAAVDAGHASSQRDIATRLNVAPSLVVSLVDQLADLGAVGRERSAADRRVQVITLTPKGRELLAESAAAAEELDAELRARLSPAGRKALATALDELELSD